MHRTRRRSSFPFAAVPLLLAMLAPTAHAGGRGDLREGWTALWSWLTSLVAPEPERLTRPFSGAGDPNGRATLPYSLAGDPDGRTAVVEPPPPGASVPSGEPEGG